MGGFWHLNDWSRSPTSSPPRDPKTLQTLVLKKIIIIHSQIYVYVYIYFTLLEGVLPKPHSALTNLPEQARTFLGMSPSRRVEADRKSRGGEGGDNLLQCKHSARKGTGMSLQWELENKVSRRPRQVVYIRIKADISALTYPNKRQPVCYPASAGGGGRREGEEGRRLNIKK